MLVLCLSAAVTLADQVTKHMIRRRLGVGEHVPVIDGLFSLRHVQNTGAAWGMLEGLNHWLIVLSAVMLVVLVVFRRQFVAGASVCRVALGFMIGGIAGNLIDRLRLGYVVDFLDFFWRVHHFPAFNVADAAICTGVGLYILSYALRKPAAGAPLHG
jgi:signal peptidase II